METVGVGILAAVEPRLGEESSPEPTATAGVAERPTPLGLFLRIMVTKGEARLRHGRAFMLATEGETLERSLAAFRADPRGEQLARERPNSLALLHDRAGLKRCPPKSLGRSYAEFMLSDGLDETYYAGFPVSEGPNSEGSQIRRWYRDRLEVGHDLRHMLTGYPPNEAGEVCLQSFRAGQNGHLGARCLALLGLLHPRSHWRATVEAYRRGRRARLLDLLIWEDRLDEPLAEIRASLNLTPPRHFREPCAPDAYLEAVKRPSLKASPYGRSSRDASAFIDIADAFGPMSAMHAALDDAGMGMPCGVTARFLGTAKAEADAAVAAAAAMFPVLATRLTWRASRPVLESILGWRAGQARLDVVDLGFRSDGETPLWRYALRSEGDDVRLSAVWAHAAADGRSMLHFLETVNAALRAEPLPERVAERSRLGAKVSMVRWLPRFLFERALSYVRIDDRALHAPGISRLCLPGAEGSVAKARNEVGGFAAWLAAAALIAFCVQQRGAPGGRASLNLLVSRDDLARWGGFGMAAGSLLISVKLDHDSMVRSVARRIHARQRAMIARAWDEHLEQFIGRGSVRRRIFAWLATRGAPEPSINVSWKGFYPRLGANAGVTDVACFAASDVAHVSAHVDGDGLSISVASRQSPEAREALLRSIAGMVYEGPVDGLAVSRL